MTEKTRLEKRGSVYPRGVLRVCGDVHATWAGSFERDPREQVKDISLLQTVLDTWDDSNELPYDGLVKRLVEYTIWESRH